MAENRDDGFEASPATRLLDALGRGDLNAALLEFRPTTIVRTEDRTWSLQGEEQVLYGLEDALNLFPGLVFDSHARHIGLGRVIEEARVRDLGPLDALDGATAEGGDGPTPSGPDGADAAASGANRSLVLDRDFGTSETPRLNMPLRLTVVHDDRDVHEIILSFPRALLRAALGEHVDQLDLSVSEIQSAFVAPVGSGFTTYELGNKLLPSLEFAPPPPAPEPKPEPVPVAEVEDTPSRPAPPPPFVLEQEEEPRSRARVVVPLVMIVVAAIAGGAWWLGPGNGTPEAKAKPTKPHNSASQTKDTKPTKKPSSAQASPSKTPKPTKTKTPDLVLSSDLAFPKGSAALSDAAKSKIGQIADDVRAAKLEGTIRIDGYTDNLGSAESGVTLSQDRAEAVAEYLRLRLGDYDIDISSFGHGENDPIASNATEAGRQKNRRVTITLPQPTS